MSKYNRYRLHGCNVAQLFVHDRFPAHQRFRIVNKYDLPQIELDLERTIAAYG